MASLKLSFDEAEISVTLATDICRSFLIEDKSPAVSRRPTLLGSVSDSEAGADIETYFPSVLRSGERPSHAEDELRRQHAPGLHAQLPQAT